MNKNYIFYITIVLFILGILSTLASFYEIEIDNITIIPILYFGFGLFFILTGIFNLYFLNVRKHIDFLERKIGALDSATAIQKIQIPQPVFLSRHAVSADFLELIIEIIRRDKPQRILELGSGSSTLYLISYLRQINRYCHYYVLEENVFWSELIESEVKQMADYNPGDLLPVMIFSPLRELEGSHYGFYDLDQLNQRWPGSFDLIIVDGPGDVTLRKGVLTYLFDRVSSNGTIIFDDGDHPEISKIIKICKQMKHSTEIKYYPTLKGTWIIRKNPQQTQLPLP